MPNKRDSRARVRDQGTNIRIMREIVMRLREYELDEVQMIVDKYKQARFLKKCNLRELKRGKRG